MEQLSEEAKQARREYTAAYRKANRERLKEYYKNWRAKHPEKGMEYQRRFWERKAQELAAASSV